MDRRDCAETREEEEEGEEEGEGEGEGENQEQRCRGGNIGRVWWWGGLWRH